MKCGHYKYVYIVFVKVLIQICQHYDSNHGHMYCDVFNEYTELNGSIGRTSA